MTFPRKMEVRWSKRALHDLFEIHGYIASDKPAAAKHQIDLFLRAGEGLLAFPGKGRLGRVKGTRELVVSGTSHIMVYEILASTLFIVAILHGARRWPRSFAKT